MSIASNMTLIETKTVGSGGSASIDFTGIPQTFTDIVIVHAIRTNRAAAVDSVKAELNGATTNYSLRWLEGDGSSASSTSSTYFFAGNATGTSNTANTFGNGSLYIPNYAGNTNKIGSVDSVNENNATSAFQYITASLWSNTAAITSISLKPVVGTSFDQYSTASLYGIKSASKVAKATGGNISYTNGYWVHTFNASGTFTPTANLSNVEYIVVAGGGGGGSFYGGGGGAGGYRSSVTGELSGGGASAEAKLSLTSGTAYTVTVGAGGPSAGSTTWGSDGNASAFDTITTVGGGGGGYQTQAGRTGGSGGGGGGGSNGISGGSGTTSQGFAGATSASGVAGGGGGAGNSNLGGGAGVQSSINGIATYRAGGAAGNSGSNNQPGSVAVNAAGPANSGSGGGGNGGSSTLYAGGSGVVIVRYAA